VGVGPPDTAVARGAPVGEGLDVYRIPMPFLRLGPWRGDHYHSVGAGREADASGARARLSACRGGRRVVQTPELFATC
jgi:hypothetical protein